MDHFYVELIRSTPTVYIDGRTQGYRFTVQAVHAYGLPNEIFVYQRVTRPDGVVDLFTNIASPLDLQYFPVDNPMGNVPFFRKTVIDLIFPSLDTADEAWKAIKNDVDQLIESLKFNSTLVVSETVHFGDLPSSSSSSSSSTSSSSAP